MFDKYSVVKSSGGQGIQFGFVLFFNSTTWEVIFWGWNGIEMRGFIKSCAGTFLISFKFWTNYVCFLLTVSNILCNM